MAECASEQIGVGKGFLSYIVKCQLVWNPPHPDLPNRVLLKVSTF